MSEEETKPKKKYWCSFCGKSDTEIEHIVSTPSENACICNVCIELCRDIIGEARMKRDAKPVSE